MQSIKETVQIEVQELLGQLSARSTARERELLRRTEMQEAELLELRANTAGMVPTLHRQVFDELKEAKSFYQKTTAAQHRMYLLRMCSAGLRTHLRYGRATDAGIAVIRQEISD